MASTDDQMIRTWENEMGNEQLEASNTAGEKTCCSVEWPEWNVCVSDALHRDF